MRLLGPALAFALLSALGAHAASPKDGDKERDWSGHDLRQYFSQPVSPAHKFPDAIPDAGELEKLLAHEAAQDPEDLFRLGLAYESEALWEPDNNKAFSYFQRSEALGYPYAKAQVGYYYETGLAGVQDYEKAVSFYQDGADFGDAWAGLRLGYMYLDGLGVRKHESQAFFWINWASQAGVTEAIVALGWLYEFGIGTDKDIEEAARLYGRAGDEGLPSGWVLLGLLHEHGTLGQVDLKQAVALYRKAAEAGYGQGNHHLGTMYYWGRGVEEDKTRAIVLFREAADLGYVDAHVSLGLAYEQGGGVKQDYAEAAAQYRLAIDKNRGPRALAYLGWLHAEGLGVEQDLEAARALYDEASQADDLFALTELGLGYVAGAAVTGSDVNKGRRLLEKAADAEHLPAILSLGEMYSRGNGVAVDPGAAADWYRKAIDLGSVDGMRELGTLYEDGEGVEQDYGRALELYQQALDRGSQGALLDLGVLFTTEAFSGHDYEKGLNYLEKAYAAQVDASAAVLGIAYFDGEWVEQDLVRARGYFQKAAENGNWLASAYLGYLEENGLGGLKEIHAAVRHYESAAEGGNLYAAQRLVELFTKGTSVTQSRKKVLKWRIRAAELGDAEAAYLAAEELYDSVLHRDLPKASELYRVAADAGNLDASVKWARMQILGEVPGGDYFAGVHELSQQAKAKPLSVLSAFSWMTDQGEETAYYSRRAKEKDLFLGIAHLYGIVLPQDFDQAKTYLRKVVAADTFPDVAPFALAQVPIEKQVALPQHQGEIHPLLERSANRGIMAAQMQLAENFDHGYFTGADPEKAAFWYRLAAPHSDKAARRLAEIAFYNAPSGSEAGDALETLESLAEAGDATSAYSLAQTLAAHGEWQDIGRAARYAQKALRFGESGAHALLGWLNLNGGLEGGSWQKALSHLTKGAEAGDGPSMYALGENYAWGTIGARDLDKARRWLTRAAEKGEVYAQASLGNLLTSPAFSAEEDLEEGIEWLQSAARGNDAYATYSLGVAALRGRGLEREPIVAMQYFQTTWHLNRGAGQAALGDYHYYGGDGEPDYIKANEHYLMAAELGDQSGRLYAAWQFRYGVGVDADPGRAADLLRENSDAGNLMSTVELAKLYLDGVGVPRDYGKALELLHEAGRRGSAQAAVHIGWMTLNGFGVDRDVELGLRAVRRAAAQQVPDALYLQAVLLEKGLHVPKDLDRAIAFYKRAADYEIYPAFEALKRLKIDYQALGGGTPLKYRVWGN